MGFFGIGKIPDQFAFVEIETSTACNLRCRYCPNSISDRGLLKNNRQMPESLFCRLVDELEDMGFEGELHPHFYNEPLLDQRLPHLLAYVRSKLPRCRICVFTNGVLLTLEKYMALASAGVNGIEITRHTPTDPSHIADILAYRSSNGDGGIELNYNKAGVDGAILFNRCGMIPLRRIVETGKGCTWPCHYLTINYRGDVLLCCNDYFASFPVGNVSESSIAQIWDKPYNRALRVQLCKDASKVAICRKCESGFF